MASSKDIIPASFKPPVSTKQVKRPLPAQPTQAGVFDNKWPDDAPRTRGGKVPPSK
jgi:hypothetical protein